jgi:ribokinase
MSGRVIVVGSVNVDAVVQAEHLPAPGETVLGGTFAQFAGGKGGNQAVAAARLGVPTWFVGAVGDDAFGTEARAQLEADDVHLEGLVTVPGIATGLATIIVDAAGENLIAVAAGANAALDPASVRAALDQLAPGPGDVILVGHEIPTETARAALRFGRAADARTILNPAPVAGLDRSTFAIADVLTPNRGELRQLAGNESNRYADGGWSADDETPTGRTRSNCLAPSVDDIEAAARSLLARNRRGPGVGDAILVTLGAAGALLVRRGGDAIELPAQGVSPVDTVGAGDALNGALAAGLATGLDLVEAARRAVAAATLSVTRAGARPGLPIESELEAFLVR